MPGNATVGASYGDLLVTSLVVLAAVCIAAFVVVRLAGRLLAPGRSRGAHVLAVVARLPLEPKRSLYVVEVAGKMLLVGTSEMGLSLLSELDGGQLRAHAEPRPSFGELVRAAWLGRRGLRAGGPRVPGEVGGAGGAAPAGLERGDAPRTGAAVLADLADPGARGQAAAPPVPGAEDVRGGLAARDGWHRVESRPRERSQPEAGGPDVRDDQAAPSGIGVDGPP